MRISEKLSRANLAKKENKCKIAGTADSVFAVQMQQKQLVASDYEQEVIDLRQNIDQVGQELEKEPNLGNFRKFRELLSKLVTRIGKEAYRLDKIGGTSQNPRYYEIVTIINQEADRLYEMIVNEQRDRMAITAKVIGIKGLVVDLIT
ncbi:YaaR family protein [Pelotalea chapellei]|uniref:DUF327 family protein n=1 Tax=Pelotalea chapellei TaxID=44671 RepID=A0ABS5UCF0_9BACT|nr:YaaR family protein [Pelotalea chapellei]MBT1073361.1 DUF327 family protein [Pelotalea chapellei]